MRKILESSCVPDEDKLPFRCYWSADWVHEFQPSDMTWSNASSPNGHVPSMSRKVSSGWSGTKSSTDSHVEFHLPQKKNNKYILLITRKKGSHPNWKRNGILNHMVLDLWPKTVSEGTSACATSPLLQSQKSWSWRAGNPKQGYKLTEGSSRHLLLQIYKCNKCSV